MTQGRRKPHARRVLANRKGWGLRQQKVRVLDVGEEPAEHLVNPTKGAEEVGCHVTVKKWSGACSVLMAADAVVAQNRFTHPEVSSAIARRTAGREQCARAAGVPRVALLCVLRFAGLLAPYLAIITPPSGFFVASHRPKSQFT